MFRHNILAVGLHLGLSDPDITFPDEAALNLLQLKVERSNSTSSHNWWRNGGCAADLADPRLCSFNTDTHLSHRFAGGATNDHRLGAQPLARTTDDSTSIDAFQCQFNNAGMASICGVAMQMGDHKIECESIAPDCHSYLYCTLDGEPLTFDSFPKKTASGLLITKTSTQMYCFDSPDGRSSATIRSHYMNVNGDIPAPDCRERSRMQIRGRAPVGSTNWIDGQVRIESEIAVTSDNSLCGGPGSISLPLSDSLFSAEASSRMCGRANSDATPDCENMPDPPQAPGAQETCEAEGCSFETAETVCAPLEQHDVKYQGCLLDVCSGCGNSDDGDSDMAQIAGDDVEEEEEDEPGPVCVDAGADCNMPETCSSAVNVNLDTVGQNNLGGIGPDDGEEELRFTSAALVGDKVIDLVVKGVGGDYKGKGAQNGKKGQFGVLSMKAGHDVELEFTFVDSDGAAVVLDSLALSFYDLDEGKKGKSRSTLTACKATNAILTTNTELTLQRPDNCFEVSSSQHGTKANNPTAPGSLTQEQGGRSVTFVYSGVSSVTVTMAVSKGFGFRNTFWSLEPSLPCLAGEASDLPLPLTEPVDMTVPSERTCPNFEGNAQITESVSGQRYGHIWGNRKGVRLTLGDCMEQCGRQSQDFNAICIEQNSLYSPGAADTSATHGTELTGRDSLVDLSCTCAKGVAATISVDPSATGTYVTVFCPPWKPWCNMAIADKCLELKVQTKLGDGTPWTWKNAGI